MVPNSFAGNSLLIKAPSPAKKRQTIQREKTKFRFLSLFFSLLSFFFSFCWVFDMVHFGGICFHENFNREMIWKDMYVGAMCSKIFIRFLVQLKTFFSYFFVACLAESYLFRFRSKNIFLMHKLGVKEMRSHTGSLLTSGSSVNRLKHYSHIWCFDCRCGNCN